MAHIILTGATGTAGSAILTNLLHNPSVARVTVLSRRPVQQVLSRAQGATPHAEVVIQDDFTSYTPEVLSQLRGATACIWALGASSVGMQEDAYTRLTVDYALASARAFGGLAKPDGKLKFVFMSGEGADMDLKKGGMMFARVKGRAERELLELGREQDAGLDVYVVRPGGINPGRQNLAERRPTMQDRTMPFLARALELFWPSGIISTDALAKVCVKLALGNGKGIAPAAGVEADGRILRNTALRRIAKEAK